MSVMLFSIKESVKINNTLSKDPRVQEFVETTKEFAAYKDMYNHTTPEDFISRAIWYSYVANTTAYNLQYRENEPIDYDFNSEDDYDFVHEAVYMLGRVIYNCYTNDGNCFLQDKWMKVIKAIYTAFEAEIPREEEYPEYLY